MSGDTRDAWSDSSEEDASIDYSSEAESDLPLIKRDRRGHRKVIFEASQVESGPGWAESAQGVKDLEALGDTITPIKKSMLENYRLSARHASSEIATLKEKYSLM